MGARVGVESTVNRGSTFWIELESTEELPVLPQSAEPDPRDAAEPIARPGHVLYIEDNPANVRLMTRILERRPAVTLHHAGDAPAAFAEIAARLPDLILLDLHLPDVPGDEILRRLCANPATADVPKVIVTADATVGLVRRLKAAGAVDCVTKPLDVEKILRLLDELLAKTPGVRTDG
jgi:CheY-like chemotaxis protein